MTDVSHLLAQVPISIGPIQGPAGNKLDVPGGIGNAGPTALSSTFNAVISFLIGFMTVLAGLFFLFQIFLAAISWLNAGGNDKNVTEAKGKIINAMIGLGVVVAAYAIVGLASKLLGLDILNAPLSIF